jgi:hypothetical protein
MGKQLVIICEHSLSKKTTQNERQKRFKEGSKQRLGEVTESIIAIMSGDIISSVNIKRSTSRAIDKFVVQWYEETATRGIECQCLLLPKILKHTIWTSVMPNYSEMEHDFSLISNISKG